jgi:DNA repair protein RecO (recombination protein O)
MQEIAMALEKSDAIVLKVVPWSESSCIATLWTDHFGKISVLAKGARRPKSPFESAIDLLAICRIVFLRKSADSLDLLTEAKLERRFRAGQKSLLALYCGFYVVELLATLTEEGVPIDGVYQKTVDVLEALDNQQPPFPWVACYELQLFGKLGHQPSFDRCVQCDLPRSHTASTDPVRLPPLLGISSGGYLCRSCAAGHRQVVAVDSRTIDWLALASQPDCQPSELKVPENTAKREIRGFLTAYTKTLVGRNLRVIDFLDDLGR